MQYRPNVNQTCTVVITIVEPLDHPQNVQVNRPCQKIRKFPTRKYFAYIWTHLTLPYTKYFHGENSRNINATRTLHSNIFSKIHCEIMWKSFLRRKKWHSDSHLPSIVKTRIRYIRVLLLHMGWNYIYPWVTRISRAMRIIWTQVKLN